MRFHILLRYTGTVLLFEGVFLLISAAISFGFSDTAVLPLFYSFIITTLFGIFPIIFVPPTDKIQNKEGFVIVVTGWLLVCLVGIMPYVLWGGPFTLTNAWFESVSGFTTTGSSILNDIEALPPGLLFWRSATHWMGGIGIIVFMLAVLPSMGKAQMVLYRSEMSSLAMENFKYRTRKTLHILIYVYVGLTAAETLSLLFCGMNWFDAITHSFGTIATGGFSPRNSSIASYASVSVEIVIMVFMVLSGIHFALLFLTITGASLQIYRSSVVRTYLMIMGIGVLIVTLSIHGKQYENFLEALRYGAFMVISLGTSTGFATADTAFWSALAQLVMIFFTLQCACAGSTSGGIKVDRIVIFWKGIGKRITQMKHPHAVITPKVDGTALNEDMIESSALYIVLYMAIVFLSSILLSTLGVDMLTAFTGSAATMGNVGPGFGMVGSMSNYSEIPEIGKWVLTADMLLGRLEIFGLALMFLLRSWR
ncbi:MAG: TrkH family potassium uptake protein [Thermodesulfobacteriota bacterium]